MNEQIPVPTKRATVGLIKVQSCNAMRCYVCYWNAFVAT